MGGADQDAWSRSAVTVVMGLEHAVSDRARLGRRVVAANRAVAECRGPIAGQVQLAAPPDGRIGLARSSTPLPGPVVAVEVDDGQASGSRPR